MSNWMKVLIVIGFFLVVIGFILILGILLTELYFDLMKPTTPPVVASPQNTPTEELVVPLISTPTPTAPGVQPTEKQLYYEVGFSLAGGIYHFRSSKCLIEPQGYDSMWRSISIIILKIEENDIVFKLRRPAWVIVTCRKAADYSISQDSRFDVRVWYDNYNPLTLVQWNYVRNNSIEFSIWFWIGPE